MLLDPSVVFLNHGSFGACPAPVFAAYQQWQRELERQPVEFLGRRSEALLDGARETLAGYLGADPECVAFVPNATEGINVVARSLRLQPGDEVVGTDLEYGACDRTWDHLCERFGARYRRAHIPLPASDPDAIVEAIWAEVTPRTRAIFLSHITSATALTWPVAAACQRARAEGIFTVVDGAHAPGQLPLDLDDIGADAYSANLHKWVSAPKGSGFLHVRREHHAWMESPVVSWGWVEESPHFRPGSPFVSRNQWQGTRDPAAYLSVPAAIAYQQERDWPVVRAAGHELAKEARRRIVTRFGQEPLSPEPEPDGYPWFIQMVACPLPPLDPLVLKRRLYDEHRVEAPITVWNDRPFIRLSFQGYNTRGDLEAALAALDALVPELTE
ncbi:MAG: aminotransferase class V-fold PLP-dependent enzyme [Thermomicrobiales bacterium]|nr:aminotransferase class V-fold PLP-dependent enzyme [Thermomicrobiales bacterium]